MEIHTGEASHTLVCDADQTLFLLLRSPQPLVTPFYCEVCNLYSTSEEQLATHRLGKRHTKLAAIKAAMARNPGASPASMAAAMTWLHGQHSPSPARSAGPWASSLLPSAAATPPRPLAASAPCSPTKGAARKLFPPSYPTTPNSPRRPGGEDQSEAEAGAEDAAGPEASASSEGTHGPPLPGGTIRCDLCGVVTPSARHFEYHLQVKCCIQSALACVVAWSGFSSMCRHGDNPL